LPATNELQLDDDRVVNARVERIMPPSNPQRPGDWAVVIVMSEKAYTGLGGLSMGQRLTVRTSPNSGS